MPSRSENTSGGGIARIIVRVDVILKGAASRIDTDLGGEGGGTQVSAFELAETRPHRSGSFVICCDFFAPTEFISPR